LVVEDTRVQDGGNPNIRDDFFLWSLDLLASFTNNDSKISNKIIVFSEKNRCIAMYLLY
jgi:hypothetical protein